MTEKLAKKKTSIAAFYAKQRVLKTTVLKKWKVICICLPILLRINFFFIICLTDNNEMFIKQITGKLYAKYKVNEVRERKKNSQV